MVPNESAYRYVKIVPLNHRGDSQFLIVGTTKLSCDSVTILFKLMSYSIFQIFHIRYLNIYGDRMRLKDLFTESFFH